METEYKIKLPLITDEELLEIDKNWEYLIDKYLMMTLKEKDQLIAQYVMGKQKGKIERLNNIIDRAIEYIDKTDTFQIVHSIDGYWEKLRNKTKKDLLEILKGEDK